MLCEWCAVLESRVLHSSSRIVGLTSSGITRSMGCVWSRGLTTRMGPTRLPRGHASAVSALARLVSEAALFLEALRLRAADRILKLLAEDTCRFCATCDLEVAAGSSIATESLERPRRQRPRLAFLNIFVCCTYMARLPSWRRCRASTSSSSSSSRRGAGRLLLAGPPRRATA